MGFKRDQEEPRPMEGLAELVRRIQAVRDRVQEEEEMTGKSVDEINIELQQARHDEEERQGAWEEAAIRAENDPGLEATDNIAKLDKYLGLLLDSMLSGKIVPSDMEELKLLQHLVFRQEEWHNA